MIAVESGFDPAAVSDKGALGLMQLTPETGARYGVAGDKTRSLREKLLDPPINVSVGTRYLRDLLALFGDDLGLALAAYNAGEDAVRRYQPGLPAVPGNAGIREARAPVLCVVSAGSRRCRPDC